MMKPKLSSSLNTTQTLSHHKSANKSISGSNVLNKSNKIYVPIEAPQNITNLANLSFIRHNNEETNKQYTQLKKLNNQLKQKQQIYIDKLLKLEQGLEKQHLQFMQLQDLYNTLFTSYKHKQQQISQLQLKYRQSDRNKKNINQQQVYLQPSTDQINHLSQTITQKDKNIYQLENQIESLKEKNKLQEKNMQKLNIQINYYKSKEKMNDSRASLNSKVFQQLEEWQKIADNQKQQRIKIQYQNQFLSNRNCDLETRVKDLQSLLNQKQAQIVKLRHNNISLHRQNSEARLSRSKSPRNPQQQSSPKKQNSHILRVSRTIEALHSQNRKLKQQIQRLQKQKLNKSNILISQKQYPNYMQFFNSENSRTSQNTSRKGVRQEQFFSFSREEAYGFPSHLLKENNQGRDKGQQKCNKRLEQQDEIPPIIKIQTKNRSQQEEKNKKIQMIFPDYELQELPSNMEVENLIKSRKKLSNLSLPEDQICKDLSHQIPSFPQVAPNQ